jgi:hypothetical protein
MGISIATLFNAFYILLGASAAVAGLGMLCGGIYKLRQAPVSRLSYYRKRWGLDAAVDDTTLRAALRVLSRIKAWELIFAGPGMTLVSIVWLSIGWSEGSFLYVGIFNGWALLISIIISIVILKCAGRAYGIRRMRAIARNHSAYGDLRPRRVRDYVSVWVGVAVATTVLELVILTGTALIFARVPLRIQLDWDQWIYLPFGRWDLLAVPLLMVVFLALGLGMIRWMVALPRLKSLDEVPDVGVFDMHFRRESIHLILIEYSSLMFFSFLIQWRFVIANVPPLPVPMLILMATLISNAILYLAMIIGLYAGGKAGPARRGSAPVAP